MNLKLDIQVKHGVQMKHAGKQNQGPVVTYLVCNTGSRWPCRVTVETQERKSRQASFWGLL